MTAGFLAGYSPLTLSGLGQPSDPETPPPVSPRCARDVALRFVAQPEFEDGLGAVQAPAGAGDVHAVFDQVAAGTFDDAGGDRPARGQRARVVEVLLLVVQVVGGGVGVAALLGSQATAGGFAADRGGDQAGVAGQDLQCFVSDPFLRVWVAFGVEAPGGFPHVLQDVDEVDDDAQVDVPGAGLCGAGPQRLGAHHEALAVEGQGQDIAAGQIGQIPGQVELVHVGRGPPGQLADLTVTQP